MMQVQQRLAVATEDRYSVQANQLARRLLRHQRNRHMLASWLHLSRRDPAAHALLTVGPGARPVHADLWLNSMGLPMPGLDAFRRGAQAFYGLSVPNMVRLARLRALYAYAGELRHWINARHRALLTCWLGPQALRWMHALLIESPADAVHCTAVSSTPLDGCAADSLAWQGYCLMVRDGLLFDSGPCALIPFALDTVHAAGVPTLCEHADAYGSAAVARLALRYEETLA